MLVTCKNSHLLYCDTREHIHVSYSAILARGNFLKLSIVIILAHDMITTKGTVLKKMIHYYMYPCILYRSKICCQTTMMSLRGIDFFMFLERDLIGNQNMSISSWNMFPCTWSGQELHSVTKSSPIEMWVFVKRSIDNMPCATDCQSSLIHVILSNETAFTCAS